MVRCWFAVLAWFTTGYAEGSRLFCGWPAKAIANGNREPTASQPSPSKNGHGVFSLPLDIVFRFAGRPNAFGTCHNYELVYVLRKAGVQR
jgi:hypothetical protein